MGSGQSLPPSTLSLLAFRHPRLAVFLPLGFLLLSLFAGSSSSSRALNGGVRQDSILRPPLFSSYPHPSGRPISVQAKSPTSLSWATGSSQPVCFLGHLSYHSPPAQLISLLTLENAKRTFPSGLFTYHPLCRLTTSRLSRLCSNGTVSEKPSLAPRVT